MGKAISRSRDGAGAELSVGIVEGKHLAFFYGRNIPKNIVGN